MTFNFNKRCEIKISISYIIIVIIIFFISGSINANYIKSNSNLSFSNNLFLLIKYVLAVEDNGSSSNTYNNNVLNTTLIDDLIEKDRELNDRGDYLGALNISDTILSVDKNDTDAMISKGDVLDELEKPEEALVWYNKALNQTKSDNNETDIDIGSNKAFVLGTKLQQYDKAFHL